MTLNSSGPISLAGTTAGQSIEVENGGPGTTQISLNDAAVRTLAGVPSGVITMPTDFYGKSNTVVLNLTISSNTYNYDLWSAVSSNPSYSAGKTSVTLTINPGVTVGSTSTGTAALLVPASFNPADTVAIVNNGTVQGTGASGGSGGGVAGNTAYPGSNGGGGGSALSISRATTITNNGSLLGGGGGGGGGGSARGPRAYAWGGGGGGGGAGYNGGGGGGGGPTPTGSNGNPGGSGNSGGGGGGGNGGSAYGYAGAQGGSGGGVGGGGSNGSPQILGFLSQGSPGNGGGAGAYISGNSNVTWNAYGYTAGNVA